MTIFDKCLALAGEINSQLSASGDIDNVVIDSRLGISDYVYSSSRYRKAQVSIVDAREQRNLWLLHVSVFPHTNDPSPIYGFDIIAGRNKVSGAFHDFSPAGEPWHPMFLWYKARVHDLQWNRRRELPEWAKQIFSDSIVAIGAVGEDELDSFNEIGLNNLDFYLKNVGLSQESGADFHMAQNRYCHYQKQNPHTPRVLINLGFTPEEAQKFVENTFTEIE